MSKPAFCSLAAIAIISVALPALAQTPTAPATSSPTPSKSPAAQPPNLAALAAKMAASKRVLDDQGQLVAPWTHKRLCPVKDSKQGCLLAIVNLETGEVARVGEKWATAFESSGVGKEVRRATQKRGPPTAAPSAAAPSKKP